MEYISISDKVHPIAGIVSIWANIISTCPGLFQCFLLLSAGLVLAAGDMEELTTAAQQGDAGAQERLREHPETVSMSPAGVFARQVETCKTPDPAIPSSAFNLTKSAPDENGDYHVNYACGQACADWRECLVPAYKDDGMELLAQGRNPDEPKLALAL